MSGRSPFEPVKDVGKAGSNVCPPEGTDLKLLQALDFCVGWGVKAAVVYAIFRFFVYLSLTVTA